MSKSITQDMRYRQSLMQYAAKYGVSVQAGIQQESVVYLLLEGTLDGSAASLACQSRRPHHHPNQHTEAATEAHPRHAEAESHAGNGRALAPASQRGYTRCPEVCSGSCASWGCSRRQRSKQPTKQSHTNRCSIPASVFR